MIKDQENVIDDYKWELSRKEFINSLLILGASSSIPFLSSCEAADTPKIFDCSPLSIEQLRVLQTVQLILFPKSGNGPSALEVNSDKWFVYLANDQREPQREKDFMMEHLDGLNNVSVETDNKTFDILSKDRQEELLESFFEDKIRKRWGSRMLTLIFEALLLDPIYGVNNNESGWDWLNHNPGIPRPIKENMYPTIYTTMNEV